jgi:hypothetical protein
MAYTYSNASVVNAAIVTSGNYGGGITMKDGGIGSIWMENSGGLMNFGVGTTSGLGAALTITSSGNIGIGTISPTSLLHVNGTASASRFYSPGIANVATGYTVCVSGTNQEFDYVVGNSCQPSDGRLKKNVLTLPADGSLDQVMKLRPVAFDWKDQKSRGGQRNIGFIAQEVQKVIPDVVLQQQDGYFTVQYDNMTAVLAGAIQQIKALFDGLVTEVEHLAARVDEAFTRLASHDDRLKNLEEENKAMRHVLCKLDASAVFCK